MGMRQLSTSQIIDAWACVNHLGDVEPNKSLTDPCWSIILEG